MVLLWDGSILLKDNSLQLLLIIDYIFDWARDVYRPSILRQLKSMASGIAYDQVSVIFDNDVHSLRRDVSNWMPAAPSIIADPGPLFESELGTDSTTNLRQFLPFEIPNTRFGSLRSANYSRQKATGICLTDTNVKEFLRAAVTNTTDKEKSMETVARDILKSFRPELQKGPERRGKFEHPNLERHGIILSGSDIQALEESWIGDVTVINDAPALPPDEEFYCLISFECFLNSSWEIEKQITYLAVTSQAFRDLASFAHYTVRFPLKLATTDWWASRLNDTAFQNCINCLLSASPSQSLLAALSAKSLTWCTQRGLTSYEHKRPESENVLSFDFNTLWGQGYVVEKHLKGIQRTKMDMLRLQKLPKEWQTKSEKQRYEGIGADFSFCRVFENIITIPDGQYHSAATCLRCAQSHSSNLRTDYEPWDEGTTISTNGMVLVEGLDVKRKSDSYSSYFSRPEIDYWHDLCLFAIDPSSYPNSLRDITHAIETILESQQMYHTVKSPSRGWNCLFDPESTPLVMWNLPLSYRPIFPKLASDILNWLSELKGEQTTEPTANDTPVPPLTVLNQLYFGLVAMKLPYDDVLAEVYDRRQADWLQWPASVSTGTTSRYEEALSKSRNRIPSPPRLRSPSPELQPGSSVEKPTTHPAAIVLSSDSDSPNSEGEAKMQ